MAFTFGEQGNIGNIFREQGNIVKIILGNIGNYFRGTREHWALLSGNKGTWTPPGRPSITKELKTYELNIKKYYKSIKIGPIAKLKKKIKTNSQ